MCLLAGMAAMDSSDYSLYVATVGGWLGNIINPLQLPNSLKSIRESMIGDGLPAEAPVFIAAHSLGGKITVFVDLLVNLIHESLSRNMI